MGTSTACYTWHVPRLPRISDSAITKSQRETRELWAHILQEILEMAYSTLKALYEPSRAGRSVRLWSRTTSSTLSEFLKLECVCVYVPSKRRIRRLSTIFGRSAHFVTWFFRHALKMRGLPSFGTRIRKICSLTRTKAQTTSNAYHAGR